MKFACSIKGDLAPRRAVAFLGLLALGGGAPLACGDAVPLGSPVAVMAGESDAGAGAGGGGMWLGAWIGAQPGDVFDEEL